MGNCQTQPESLPHFSESDHNQEHQHLHHHNSHHIARKTSGLNHNNHHLENENINRQGKVKRAKKTVNFFEGTNITTETLRTIRCSFVEPSTSQSKSSFAIGISDTIDTTPLDDPIASSNTSISNPFGAVARFEESPAAANANSLTSTASSSTASNHDFGAHYNKSSISVTSSGIGGHVNKKGYNTPPAGSRMSSPLPWQHPHHQEHTPLTNFSSSSARSTASRTSSSSLLNVSSPAESSSHSSTSSISSSWITSTLHEEFGSIRYQHASLAQAKAAAAQQGDTRPILCFEIDVPGDTEIGQSVLSHPLIVEAVETLFVSVRRKPRRSQQGNTRVKIYSSGGTLLTSVLNNISLATLSRAMVRALKGARSLGTQGATTKTTNVIPTYLQLLEEEENGRIRITPSGTIQKIDRTAIFGTGDCKLAEVELGGLDGVLGTRAGHIAGGQWVVQISYNSRMLSFCNLVRHALQREIAHTIYYTSNEERIASHVEVSRIQANDNIKMVQLSSTSSTIIQPGVNSKQALKQTHLRFVPLTELQATRANRLVAMGVFNEAMHLLSPRQGMILMRSMNQRNCHEHVDTPIMRAWQNIKTTAEEQ